MAPVAFSVVDAPIQSDAEPAVAVTVGNGETVIAIVFVFEQPFEPTPTTVYVVVVVGDTVTVVPLRLPGFQV